MKLGDIKIEAMKLMFVNYNIDFRIEQLEQLAQDENYGSYLVNMPGAINRCFSSLEEKGVLPVKTYALNPSEALASGSYYTVVPAYYDMAITGKYARDDESIEMLSIITGNRVFDYGDTILCTWMRDGVIRNSFEANTRDIVSALVSNEGTVNAQLVKLNGDY